MNSRVSNNRLKKGKVKLEENRPLLERIYKKYGVAGHKLCITHCACPRALCVVW
jgi:membrane-bound lytic murein transglycosylase B